MTGNPKSKGRAPSWVRQELRKGLAAALPTIKAALRTGKDPRTGALLTWADFAKTVEVASRISMPSQAQLGGMDDAAPFLVAVKAATADDEDPAQPLALVPRVASAEPVETVTTRAGAVPGTR